jgi:ABC-2 type transport system permease protein
MSVARSGSLLDELRKLQAFLRRDLMVAWSYRLAFFSDAANLVFQAALFYFFDQMIDPGALPDFDGVQPSYLAFVTVGIALGGFLQLGLNQVAAAVRSEQVMGTLESLFMTPTRPALLQMGLAVYNFIYVPIRTGLFLTFVALFFDISFVAGGIPAALLILLLFIPLVWGLGLIGAAFILTFRRGGGFVGIAGFVLSVSSGAYFPVALFPKWVEVLASGNPITVAFTATREALIGGSGMADLGSSLAILAVGAIVALWLGTATMGWALRRERRMGTLGLY